MATMTEAARSLQIMKDSLNYIKTSVEKNGGSISPEGKLKKPAVLSSDFDFDSAGLEYKALYTKYKKFLDADASTSTSASMSASSPTDLNTTPSYLNTASALSAGIKLTNENNTRITNPDLTEPFDPRLIRIDKVYGHTKLRMLKSFSSESIYSVYGDTVALNPKKLDSSLAVGRNKALTRLKRDHNQYGVQSLVNPYCLTRLYNSLAVSNLSDSSTIAIANRLIDVRDSRRFYDALGEGANVLAVANPTTSNIIRYSNQDKWGRTPYSFQDFVFCKYWNIIPNNRMLTLRKYCAPCIDSLNFGTMFSAESTSYAPIATAVTYFGEGTDNKLGDILKFSTGMRWETLDSDVWQASGEGSGTTQAEQMMDNADGMFASKLLHGMSALFNMAYGKYDYSKAKWADGNIPPDPFENGPLSNRLIGPANCIDSVQKRKRGLDFSMPINLSFKYVARPIGGVNSKAAMLDILSNLMVMCSASAVFWGGANRFTITPQVYPFFGKDGQSVLQKMYRGHVFGSEGALAQVFNGISNTFSDGGGIMQTVLGAVGGLLSKMTSILPGAIGNVMTGALEKLGNSDGQSIADNIMKNGKSWIGAHLMKGVSVPYMKGMRSLLIGEPVGEWHLTVGNPLNPIAVIGNLICKSCEVKFGEELGPDDFPLEMTVTVSLDHGMPRDRDAIESMFNRGSGRIYNLPDYIRSSDQFETTVDKVTGKYDKASQRDGGAGNGYSWMSATNMEAVSTAGSASVGYQQSIKKNKSYTSLNMPIINNYSLLTTMNGYNSWDLADNKFRSVFKANLYARKSIE